jgi:hypothetical protein
MVIRRTMRRSTPPAGSMEFGWRVHAAQESWNARADVKASILLAFQAGALVFGVTLRDLIVGAIRPFWVGVALAATAMLIASMIAAAGAVLPILGSARRHREERGRNMVYFGHLRLWDESALASRLTRLTPRDEAGMLARQLVAISRLNWRKHRLLQASVVLTVLSLIMITAAALTPHLG